MGMARRDRVVIGLVTAAWCVAALALGAGPAPALAAVGIALGAAGCWPRSRRWAGVAAGAAGALLLVATFVWQGHGTRTGSVWQLVAAAAALMLLTAAARWAPRPQLLVGGGLAATAVALWTLPLVPSASFFEYVGLAAFWTVPVIGALVVGGYPRSMERRRHLAVVAARRAQQLELAHDLHDFVAHDVSGIVVQAQAARFVAQNDPAAATLALERIERAGLAALASIDRTVRMLHTAEESGEDIPPAGARTALPGTDQLAILIDRFSDTGRTRARLDIAPGAAEALSREGAATVHRIVVEALTNVRRHAPGAAEVEVALTTDRTSVEVKVINDGGRTRLSSLPPLPRFEHGGSGGTGLPALAERVRASGGTFNWGPHQGGWRVRATLPATETEATAS
ncbi:sensor histidine kinase [Streptomyces spiramyceticus]|uniref:sensor histidine kinase n=2 Tax=Streptomyces spiramyceticus TaxID=299717 RepID=UPI00237AD6C6|nr:histidine kinase [Streptomyces spiramyceticus]